MLTALLLLGGLVCAGTATPAPRPPPLGEHPDDRVSMADIAVLAPIAASLPVSADPSLARWLGPQATPLVTQVDPTRFWSTEANADRGNQDGSPLRVLSYNVGLFDRQSWLSGRQYRRAEVPVRRGAVAEAVVGDDWDIILLQEVWNPADVKRFAVVAEREGYVWFAGSDRHHSEHGLMILVRGSLVSGAQARTEGRFVDQRRAEHRWGLGIARGYLTWSFTHAPTGRRIRVATAQLLPAPASIHVRNLQARQLGIDLAASDQETLVILGVDLGSAPWYPEDILEEIPGESGPTWRPHATTLPVLRHYAHLVDAATFGYPLDDGHAPYAYPTWTSGWRKRPLAGNCHLTPPNTFTATVCNSQFFAAHGGNISPARSDMILVATPDAQTGIQGLHLAYTDPVSLRGRTIELSDHYGVALELRIRPPGEGAAPAVQAQSEGATGAATTPPSKL